MYGNNYNNLPASSGPSLPPPPPPSYGYERYDQPPPPPYPPPPASSSRSWNDRYPPQDRRDDFHFRGPFSDLRRNRSDDRRRPDRDYRDTDRDSYRPPQGDFTFRTEPPPGVNYHDSYRPREREGRAPRTYDSYYPQPPTNHTDGHRSNHDDNRSTSDRPHHDDNDGLTGRDNRPRRNDDRRRQQNFKQRTGFKERWKPPKPAARLLLHKKHDENPELMLGDTAARATYRDIDELSDSDETEMDISDESGSDVVEPASKRARTSATATTTKLEEDVPRWSNPDPYTALPPPDESTRKKKDMVQLIRKARVEAEAKQPAAQIEGLDFISCDFDDDKEYEPSTFNSNSAHRAPDSGAIAPATIQSTPLTSHPAHDAHNARTGARDKNSIDLTSSTSLGNRKRTFDDKIKQPLQPSAPTGKGAKMSSSGYILSDWRPVANENPCPWLQSDYSDTPSIGTRMQKEITDFYLWVSPQPFEASVRQKIVDQLRKIIKMRWSDADLYLFGSFVSGLYLPTADMDIAICSNNFINRGIPRYDKKNNLWALKQHLINYNVTFDEYVEVISRAKVPLVKYTEMRSRLKFDISFEKIDGHRAIQTFLDWKAKYPVLPKLVAVVKQFLLMRGLNEPVNGGIGGFSVICMVVHLLDIMPQVQSRSMPADSHVGEILMEFFQYYGHHFKYKTVAIRMNPPGLVPKNEVSTFVYRNMDRLSILDPNNPENDIAGGSSNTETIMRHFAQAYDTMLKRIVKIQCGGDGEEVKGSLFEPILGGNYESYTKQRSILKSLHDQGFGEYSRHQRQHQRFPRDDEW
ncbi:uncharacterized protein F4822DRAFT_406191 [Hypoxylon trugodes]|uniref:uncharacterized protein n=1 Tax=Hypoxylon trugodes TaxID=326681 RepID=UPI0021921EC6|nr:uncharacterized protein F4822DRAFT_406191 [Hypoxylon trugodes]KAI1387351.1 hypothetical protein F4822DRAFT_406191 [Hypoxylon trugodes]